MTKGLQDNPRRPISLLDVIFGSIGFPLLIIGIFYALDTWLQSPILLVYPLNFLGIVFIVLGLLLTSWCFKTTVDLPKEHTLVVWGPWAYVRHPIYLAGLIINLGVAMSIGSMLLLLQFVGYTLLEARVDVPREERRLRNSFSTEYDEYSRRVPGWIPRKNRST